MAYQVNPEMVEMWPQDENDRALNERLRASGVRMATRSLDRPREVARQRPAWLAFLFTLARARS